MENLDFYIVCGVCFAIGWAFGDQIVQIIKGLWK